MSAFFFKLDLLLFLAQQKISIWKKTMATDYLRMRSNCNMKRLIFYKVWMFRFRPHHDMCELVVSIQRIMKLNLSLPILCVVGGIQEKLLDHKITGLNLCHGPSELCEFIGLCLRFRLNLLTRNRRILCMDSASSSKLAV